MRMLGESEGTRGVATIEQIGRRRTFTRTATVAAILLVVQQPMADAVRDATAGCGVSARLSLLVDFLFITAYVVAAYRGFRYVRFLAHGQWTRLARTGFAIVAAAGVSDVGENAALWRRFGSADECGSLSTGWFTWLMRLVWVVGVVALLVALAGSRRSRQPAGVSFAREPEQGPDAGRLVICCSGGGIRSASFCLGALQTLFAKGLYDKASSVIGVSGGGYMASAFHVLRRDGVQPYEPGSPELARLRRQTEYLLQDGRSKYRAALSLLYGVTVNLLLIGITLRAIAWVLGWFLADLGVIREVADERIRVDWRPNGSWWFVGLSCSLLLLGALIFLIEKIWDRWAVMPDGPRQAITGVGGTALVAGLPLAVLLLGVPGGLYLLNRLPGASSDEQPTLPQALLDLVDPNKQGIASFITLVVALIGLGRSVWTGLAQEGKGASRLRTRVIAFLRTKVAPWLGSAIIVAAAAIVLLRWTGGYATDPAYREDWSVAVVLALIAILIKLFSDANRTSLHPYYRERLSTAFLVRRAENGAAVSMEYQEPLRYSEWAKPKDGGPQLVVGAVANVSDTDFVPSRRDCVPFIFDPGQIGIVGDTSLPRGGRRVTPEYESEADFLCRDVTVPAAMAISGAAFSPLTGRVNSRTRPVRLLLAVLNARLGVWLPNPYWNNLHPEAFARPRSLWGKVSRYVGSLVDKPGAYRLLREAIGSPSLYERRIYVTDGGHYDNLGLVEAIRRRPAQVIVIDASNDPEDRFTALGEAIATARMDHGIMIDLNPSPMVRGTDPRADRAWAYGIATHPPADGEQKPYRTEIFYLKAMLAGHLGWDIEQYAAANPDFPRRSTGDQFYGEWDFEAYRALGFVLAETMVDHHRVKARLDDLPAPAGTPGPCS
jgi:hypothetical protein